MSSYGNPSMGGMAPQPVMRQSPPPRFRPCMIITVVLSLGLLFIGLTLTIIAHWPGYTAIGFNPLEIIGPVLLSLGGVVFIGCIVEVVRRNQSEKENYQRQMEERERMMSYANRTISQASLARQARYPQPAQQMQPYPPSQPYPASQPASYPPQPASYQPQPNPAVHIYADPDNPDPDDVFDGNGNLPVPKPSLHSSGPLERSMDETDYADQRLPEPGVLAPEPVRVTTSMKRKEEGRPETEAERSRRERREKKRRQKELQQQQQNEDVDY